MIFKKIKERYYYNKSIMTTRYLKDNTIKDMIKLDLFDDIPFKYLKDIIDFKTEDYKKYTDGIYDIEVEIEDLDCDRVAWCKTRFTFSIPQLIDESFGKKYYKDKEFVVEKEYNGSSVYALMMCGLKDDDEEEKDEDERLTAEYEATKDNRNSVSDDLEYLLFHCENDKQVKRIFDEDYAGQFYYDIDKGEYLKIKDDEEEEEIV